MGAFLFARNDSACTTPKENRLGLGLAISKALSTPMVVLSGLSGLVIDGEPSILHLV